MTKTCVVCGEQFEATRNTARACKSACRVKASRAKAKGIALPEPPEKPRERPPEVVIPGSGSTGLVGLTAAVERALKDADALDGVNGQAAMALARRIDNTDESTTAVTAAVKQLRETLVEALKGKRAQSKLDRLREQAAARKTA